MPWNPEDAKRHTGLASTPRLQSMWSQIANQQLEDHGDEARAIREANAAVHRDTQRARARKPLDEQS